MEESKIEKDLKKIFEENCIIEKNGKKYLNEFGSIIICFITISLIQKTFKEIGLINNKEKEKSNE